MIHTPTRTHTHSHSHSHMSARIHTKPHTRIHIQANMQCNITYTEKQTSEIESIREFIWHVSYINKQTYIDLISRHKRQNYNTYCGPNERSLLLVYLEIWSSWYGPNGNGAKLRFNTTWLFISLCVRFVVSVIVAMPFEKIIIACAQAKERKEKKEEKTKGKEKREV